jgi:DNA-binding CsgD family transcriptional regulator
MRAAQPPLMRLLGGDHAALGFSHGDTLRGSAPVESNPGRLGWIASDGLPPAFFGDYESWVAHDFVLKAVICRPRTVLRDSEMVSRSVLEANPFHRRARELGVPLQHVMAVMLNVGAMSSGLAVYRERKGPFGDRERALLHGLVPALSDAVRNCCLYEDAERRARVLEVALTNQDRAVIAFDSHAREVFRTQLATPLLKRWFGGASKTAAPLPELLSDHVKRWLILVGSTTPRTFPRRDSETMLVVTPEWVADSERLLLSIVLEERPKPPWTPAMWANLTTQERAVVAGVVRGWDNKLVAAELGCSTATVKTHLTHIYDKLAIGSRSKLISGALALRGDSAVSPERLLDELAELGRSQATRTTIRRGRRG